MIIIRILSLPILILITLEYFSTMVMEHFPYKSLLPLSLDLFHIQPRSVISTMTSIQMLSSPTLVRTALAFFLDTAMEVLQLPSIHHLALLALSL